MAADAQVSVETVVVEATAEKSVSPNNNIDTICKVSDPNVTSESNGVKDPNSISNPKPGYQLQDIFNKVDMLKKLKLKLNPLETVVAEATAEKSVSQNNTDTICKISDPNVTSESNGVKDPNSISNPLSGCQLEDIVNMVDMLKKLKLNPLAKEFVPSSHNRDQTLVNGFNKTPNGDGFRNNNRRGNKYNQGRRRMNNRAFRAQREDSIRRTVYVSELDHNVTEEQLAAIFSAYGQVADCRICGDPHSRLRFAFVEFADEYSAREALSFNGMILGFSPLKVLPSKTAILPVNPIFLPRSEDEREMCVRTVYCTNIDKKVSQADVKIFFESRCGEVSRLRLLGDHVHSTRIAFVEFVRAESAIMALDCCGEILGSQHIRVSPSKTPVRPQVPHGMMH